MTTPATSPRISASSPHENADSDTKKPKTHGFVLFSVPEHHPFWLNGHRSVTFTTILGCVLGKKGGVPVYEFSRVNLKHLPQLGP